MNERNYFQLKPKVFLYNQSESRQKRNDECGQSQNNNNLHINILQKKKSTRFLMKNGQKRQSKNLEM